MRKFLERSERILANVAGLSIVSMMCLTTVDAIGRYAFNRPIPGAYETTESYLAVAAVFFGICYAYRGGAFIRVSFFVDHMPPAVKLVLNYFVQVFSILLCAALLMATALQAYRKYGSGIKLSFLPFPIWPAYVLVSVGFLLTTWVMVLDLWKIKKGESNLFKDESPSV
jgi:TRAP-type C4-dicarboxylate transport system permease small subunit